VSRGPKPVRVRGRQAELVARPRQGATGPPSALDLASSDAACGTPPRPPFGERKGKRFHGTLLTTRQWEVLRYRAKGLTQSEVARELGVTRENVCIIEHRAWLKIGEAKATLAGIQEMATQSKVLIPSGASVFEATALILQRADLLGVKLIGSCDDILAALKSKCRGRIRGHHLVATAIVEVTRDGRLHFVPRD